MNQVYDLEIDLVNKSYRPIPSGAITKKEGLWIAIILYSIAIWRAALVNRVFLVIVCVLILITIAYSVPPFRFKKRLWISNISIAVPRGLLGYTGARSGFVTLGTLSMRRIACSDADAVMETDFIISSGALISKRVLDEVGLMDESFFIDHVDTEWIFRARSRGYRTFGACGAIMQHALGTGTFQLWFGRGRNVPLHRPERNYYLFRNTLLLARRGYAPRAWVVTALVRLGGLFFLYLIFGPDRARRLGLMAKGLWHGLRGVTGPLR